MGGGAVAHCCGEVNSLETEEEEVAQDGILEVNPADVYIPLCAEIEVEEKATRMFATIRIISEKLTALIDERSSRLFSKKASSKRLMIKVERKMIDSKAKVMRVANGTMSSVLGRVLLSV